MRNWNLQCIDCSRNVCNRVILRNPFARNTVFYYCFFFGVVLLFLLQSFLLLSMSIPPIPFTFLPSICSFASSVLLLLLSLCILKKKYIYIYDFVIFIANLQPPKRK